MSNIPFLNKNQSLEMDMKKVIAVALLAAVTSGCATQNYLVSSQVAPSSTTTADADSMQTFFISGLGQEQAIDAAQVCDGKQNVASIQTESSLLNNALGFISFGIYTPRQIRVYCK